MYQDDLENQTVTEDLQQSREGYFRFAFHI